MTVDRKAFLQQLSTQNYTDHGSSHFWHGRLLAAPENLLPPPATTWKCEEKPRDDHDDAPDWLDASEFNDRDDVLDHKLDILANLLQVSKRTVVYTGAGISRAAGIGQAARGKQKGSNRTTTAEPTVTHHALAAMHKAGLIHSWVQQNHDGLPQKAGFGQEHINEVHGSWYDPSNPVVVYSGELKTTEYTWMVSEAKRADLVLVLGTSLGGLNADQVAHRAAERSLDGRRLGTVMINLQQTQHDGSMSLRFFGESDDVLIRLLPKLKLRIGNCMPVEERRCVLVPYDSDGNKTEDKHMWLDLRPGAKIRLTADHNIAGAGQPAYYGIQNKKQLNGYVIRWNKKTVGIDLSIEGVGMLLGQWWLAAAERGGPKALPVVNCVPEFVE